MSYNKGKKLKFCFQCNRKRYCSYVSLPDDYRKIICSKGHEWIVKLATTERIINILKETIVDKIGNLFDRDNIFFKHIKK